MSRVDKWLKKGKENCAKGNHWFVLDYGTYMVCPVCKEIKPKPDGYMMEHNGYVVCEPSMSGAE